MHVAMTNVNFKICDDHFSIVLVKEIKKGCITLCKVFELIWLEVIKILVLFHCLVKTSQVCKTLNLSRIIIKPTAFEKLILVVINI